MHGYTGNTSINTLQGVGCHANYKRLYPISPKDSAARHLLRDFRRKLRCRFRTSVWLPAKRGPSPCLSGNLPLLRLVILVSNRVKPLIIRMATYSLQSVYTGISRITMHVPAQLSRYIGTEPDIQ